jgi:CPA2 family monovalent cation:H+ antiporter-2
MFMVGLEFSLPKLLAARTAVFHAGGLQVALTAVIVAAAAGFFGVDWQAATIMGGVVAMSSTAITLKQLSDQGELGSQHGRLATGILLFQDLATLPFLVLAGAGQHAGFSALSFLRQLLVGAGAFVMITVVFPPMFRAVFSWVARARSAELSLLHSLALALGTAVAADAAGLPPAIGAFLAGTVVGESDFRHQIEDDIRPFRDVLVGLFFVTVGMQIDPAIIIAAPLSVLQWAMVFLVGKSLLVALVARTLGWPNDVALRVGVILAHGGEFSLVLLTQAIRANVFDRDLGQPVLFALAFTMGLAPIVIQRSAVVADTIAGFLFGARTREEDKVIESGDQELTDHVILCGCGRVGRLVTTVLEAAKLPYIGIEWDLSRFREAKRLGHRVIFGDASRIHILSKTGLQRARLVVVTFDERRAIERVLHHARHHNPEIVSLVSTADDRDIAKIAEAGATVVYPENLAAGLELADQALLLSGLSREQASQVITEVRAEISPDLRGHVGL